MHHGRPFLFVHILLLFLLQDLGFCLNKYIDRFETLNYRPVVHQHERKKRATNILGGGGDDSPTKPIDIRFRSYAHNRTFHLKLRPINTHSSIFADNHILDVDGAYYSHVLKPHHFLYEGRLEGDPKSAVYGTLLDGIFDGYITTGDGQTFTVEKAARYFDVGQRPHNYHSIVYSDAAIDHKRLRVKRGTAAVDDRIGRQWPEEEADESSLHGCGLTKQLHQQMHRFQESAADTDEAVPASAAFTREHNNSGNHIVDLDGLSEREDFQMLLPFPDRYLNRTKRSEKPEFREIRGRRIYEVRTCTIYLQADHKLYEHIYHKEGNKDHIRTREEIVALLYTHIKAVNQIYEGTDFNGIRGINFAIKRTTIYTPQTCVPGGGERAAAAGNPFCEENVDVSNYLNMNSQKDHSAFCLAYSLTYRDFIGGTLGLAWVASPSQSTAGGICQKYQRYNEHQRGGVNRSLNTGIITLVNYGNRVPARVSQLTLAHEIGHNFGSPHDFPLECQPGLPDGNFIMFASATSGDKPNNSKFSRCSVANISEVLFEVLAQSPKGLTLGRKKNCFTDQLKSFCGNQIKEDDEQCDCGFTQQDCQEMGDQCCQPREGATDANMCRRKPGKQCSPSEGLCCDASSCSFYGRGSRTCREDSECLERQFCDGLRPDCPASRPKTNGKPCQDSTKVCHLGSCNGSLCAHHGLRDCFLTEGKPEDLCQLACEKNGLCLPSASLPELAIANLSQEGRGVGYLLLPPGSPCNNYQGYCDIFRKCRSVDSNGPLARLKNLLFNRDTIKEFTQLVKENWWACLLIGIIVLMLMALFVKCCAVHTPSTNPNKLPPANFTDTLRHPGTLLRRGHGPRPAVAQRRERPSRSGNNHHHPATSGGGANVANQQQPHGRRSSQQPPNGGGGHQPRSVRTGATANHMVAETPLIQISSSATSPPNNAVMPAEPPPPYQLTDPAAIIVVPSPPAAAVAGPSTSQQLPATPNHHRLSALLTTIPTPLPLPGAPPPATANNNNNQVLPLIPGPPHGHGPKPGRRKPKKSPHQRGKEGGKEGAKQQQQQQLAGQPSTSAKQKEMPTPGNKEKQRQNKRQAK